MQIKSNNSENERTDVYKIKNVQFKKLLILMQLQFMIGIHILNMYYPVKFKKLYTYAHKKKLTKCNLNKNFITRPKKH